MTIMGDGAGCWNETRTLAAQALVDWINAGQAGNGDPDVVVMGDMNSYAMEDPIQVFADAGYTDLSHGGYSYVFDGQWGYLDYALASASLLPQVTGSTEFHINADEVPVLDYNTNFQSPSQITTLYAPDMYRTSDHDPVLLGMNLDSGVSWAVDPTVVAGPEHSLVDVDVTATGPDDSAVDGGRSSMPSPPRPMKASQRATCPAMSRSWTRTRRVSASSPTAPMTAST